MYPILTHYQNCILDTVQDHCPLNVMHIHVQTILKTIELSEKKHSHKAENRTVFLGS